LIYVILKKIYLFLEKFDLIDFKQYNINPEEYKYPKKIVDSYHTIYYKPDIFFKISKVYISMILLKIIAIYY
jgi:hypothetical protein